MVRFGSLARVGAAVAAGGLVLGLTAIPAGSQAIPESPLVLGGSYECFSEGGSYEWFVEFTAFNNSPEPTLQAAYDIDITGATVSIGGDITLPAELYPNPIPVGETATTSGSLPSDFNGNVTLTVEWTSSSLEDSGTDSYTVAISGTCGEPVATTVPDSAPAPAVEPVAVAPAFTG